MIHRIITMMLLIKILSILSVLSSNVSSLLSIFKSFLDSAVVLCSSYFPLIFRKNKNLFFYFRRQTKTAHNTQYTWSLNILPQIPTISI